MPYNPNIDACQMQISQITAECKSVLQQPNYQHYLQRVIWWDHRTGASDQNSLENRVKLHCASDPSLLRVTHASIINALGLIITSVNGCKTQQARDSLDLNGALRALEYLETNELVFKKPQ